MTGAVRAGLRARPRRIDAWALQVLSAILVLAASCLACGGIYLVGRTACGALTAAPQPGTLRVDTGADPVVLSLDAVASVAPVSGC